MRARRRTLVVLLPLLGLTLPTCSRQRVDSGCDLVVVNQTACDLRIFVDGREAFIVRSGSNRTLTDIGPGRHVLEALDVRETVAQRRTIELTASKDFYWTLDRC
jgi:hypothetical protein